MLRNRSTAPIPELPLETSIMKLARKLAWTMLALAGLSWSTGVALAHSASVDGGSAIAPIHWQRKALSLEALPAELSDSAKAAIATWAGWGGANGYQLDLDASARLLLVTRRGSSAAAKQLGIAEQVLKRLDDTLPAAAPLSPRPASAERGGAVGDSLPEDPEEAPPGAKREPSQGRSSGASWSTQWGAGSKPLDTETVVMFAVRTETDFVALLDKLVELAPELAAWRAKAEQFPGFALEAPLAGAVVLEAGGQEEFNADNELAHRVAELSVLRRFGRQPYWVLQGWAWHVEQTVCKSFYCFPYRNGFVGVGEHSGWDRTLRSQWSKSKDELTMADVAALQRGAWDDAAARHAWGAMAHLSRSHAKELPAVLKGFYEAWDRGSRRDLGAGRWERDPNFELTLAEQQRILEAHASPKFLEDLRRFFAQGTSSSSVRR
jgi:hypothetical protein